MKKVISIFLAFTLILCITLPSSASSIFINTDYFDIMTTHLKNIFQ